MNPIDKKNIIINLSQSRNAQHYNLFTNTSENDSTLVHYNEAKIVYDFLKEFIEIAKSEDIKQDKSYKLHQHNTITILGSRGSGKTSFLLSIKHALATDGDNEWGKLGKNIEVLKIIDPTLIEEKGHVFLNVIALVKDLVEKKIDNISFDKNEYQLNGEKLDWEKRLEKLAAGIPSIDGKIDQINDGWQDPEFVMENGLKAVDASINLLQNFSDFLTLSLKILKKEAFILIFDDIDVDSKKGFTVLETIRKYFNSTKLISLISGDLEMYSLVVRQNKWENFGKEILQHENRIPYFNDLVTKLESQYLQKILKPQFRINLPTSRELIERGQIINIVTTSETQKPIEIRQVYTNILKTLGINNGFQSDAFLNFFLNLPLRSQVQFLAIFNIETGELLDSGRSLNDVASIFLSDLYAQGINIDWVLRNPKNTNGSILYFLVKKQRLEELYQLQPVTQDESLNASLVTLNFILSKNASKDPFLIFDYFIKVGYARNLIPLLGYTSNSKGDSSIEGLLQSAVLLNDNVLKDITGRIIAYIRGNVHGHNKRNSDTVSKAGTIPLFGTAANAKGKRSSVGRIDGVLKNNGANKEDAFLVLFPASINQYIYKQSSLITYSSILLLAGIGEMIRKIELKDELNGFNELSQLRSFMIPDFERGNVEDKSDEINQDEDVFSDFTEPEEYVIRDEFVNWRNRFNNDSIEESAMKISISTQLLGKIMTRFFFALSSMENNVRNRSLGEVFHSHVIAFMNAVLIEDFRENAQEVTNLNNNNSNFDNKIFSNNLDKAIASSSVNTNFSKWLISCPLLLVYLKKDQVNDDELIQKILKYCGIENTSSAAERDLQKYLSKIDIKDKDQNKNINEGVNNNVLGNLNLGRTTYQEALDRLSLASYTRGTLSSLEDNALKNTLIENNITVRGTSLSGFKEFLNQSNN